MGPFRSKTSTRKTSSLRSSPSILRGLPDGGMSGRFFDLSNILNSATILENLIPNIRDSGILDFFGKLYILYIMMFISRFKNFDFKS